MVGKVLSVEKHPNADKLTVCSVDIGKRTLKVVCGAPNVRAGMFAPLALPGTRLGKLEIKVSALRGVESEGMLCSARELGLSEDHSGLLELQAPPAPHREFHQPPLKVGQEVYRALRLDEQVLTFKLTPNRGDCLSILGIAREVAALSNGRLTVSPIKPVKATDKARHPVKHLRARGLRPLRRARDPQRERRGADAGVDARAPGARRPALDLGAGGRDQLRDAGARPPAARLRPGQARGRDRRALGPRGREGAAAERPDGRRGSLGAVHHRRFRADRPRRHHGRRDAPRPRPTTKNLFLESAFFFPEAIAGRARRYNFTSDASHRFERGVDFANNVDGIERATQLILEICGGEPGPTVDLVKRLPKRKPVTHARGARAEGHRHRCDSRRRWLAVFRRLGFEFTQQDKRIRRQPSLLPLRHRDRGGPDRGSGARARLRAHPGAPAARAGEDARAARGAPLAARAARAHRRLRLPGDHQFRLRRARLGSGLRGRGAIRSGCSTRSPARPSVMRTSLFGSSG